MKLAIIFVMVVMCVVTHAKPPMEQERAKTAAMKEMEKIFKGFTGKLKTCLKSCKDDSTHKSCACACLKKFKKTKVYNAVCTARSIEEDERKMPSTAAMKEMEKIFKGFTGKLKTCLKSCKEDSTHKSCACGCLKKFKKTKVYNAVCTARSIEEDERKMPSAAAIK